VTVPGVFALRPCFSGVRDVVELFCAASVTAPHMKPIAITLCNMRIDASFSDTNLQIGRHLGIQEIIVPTKTAEDEQ
jgi:hypothetical protein